MYIFLLALQLVPFAAGVFACRRLHKIRTGQARGFSLGEAVHPYPWTGVFWMLGILARTLQTAFVPHWKSWTLPMTPLEWSFSLVVTLCFAVWLIGTLYAIKAAEGGPETMPDETLSQEKPHRLWYGDRK